MTVTRTAVEELRRQIELAREALSVSDHFATADPVTRRQAMTLTAQLKHEIDDMEAEMGELERRPTDRKASHAVRPVSELYERRSRDR